MSLQNLKCYKCGKLNPASTMRLIKNNEFICPDCTKREADRKVSLQRLSQIGIDFS